MSFSFDSSGIIPNSWNQVPGAIGGFGQAAAKGNQALLTDVMSGYGQENQQYRSDMQNAYAQLAGSHQADIRNIDKRFTALSKNSLANLVSSGLGNSTIRGSMQTGIAVGHSDALSNSLAAFADKQYQALASMAAGSAGISSQALGFLGSTRIGYPDPSMAFAGYGQGGGQTVVGNMSRPVGGPQPAWAAYGGVGTDPGVAGGDWNQFANASAIPTTSQAAAAQRQAMLPDQSQGMWGPLYAGMYAAGTAGNAMGGQQSALMGAAGAMAGYGQASDPWANVGYPVQSVGQIPAAYAGNE